MPSPPSRDTLHKSLRGSDHPLDRAERLYDRTVAPGGPFADNTMKYRRFMSAITRYYQLIGSVTAARRCLATGVACLALFAGPRAALAAGIGSAAGEPWQSLPPTPSLPTAPQSGYAPLDRIRMVYAGLWPGAPGPMLRRGR